MKRSARSLIALMVPRQATPLGRHQATSATTQALRHAMSGTSGMAPHPRRTENEGRVHAERRQAPQIAVSADFCLPIAVAARDAPHPPWTSLRG